MVIKLPLMKKDEIDSIIRSQRLCRIAFKGSNYPYIAPFQYVVVNDSLYFHFTDYGRKMRLLKRDNRVCVEIEDLKPDLSEYNFVSLRGRLKIVNNLNERKEVIKEMAEDGRKNLSTNFLVAHGLKGEDGWSSLSPEKPVVIVKLETVKELGVKSPSTK
jgi:nitroimidazol reductase NimA-like FMN-containing flavoprotein (pyridoxamine 5'-phosphate oxidase superfamily)